MLARGRRSQEARYPLTTHPLLQQGPKLTGARRDRNASFGKVRSPDLRDGKNALVAGPA